MSDSIGTFGQKYENRKTKKVGVFVEKDEKRRVLCFLDNDTGESFEVSEASFRSNWRKVKTEVAEDRTMPAEEVDEVLAVRPPMSDGEMIQDFIDSVSRTRKIHFTANPKQSDSTEMTIDGISALCMTKDDGGVRVTMLPDLYTYSPIKDHVSAGSLHFNVTQHMSVSFICDYETFGEILQAIKNAAIEINLYGYTLE